jgi:hypothetical protein
MDQKQCKSCKMMIPKGAKICPYCRKRTGMSLLAKLLLIFIGLGIFASYMGGQKGPATNTGRNPSPSDVTNYSPEDAKAAALGSMQLKYSWRKEGFDNIMIANFTIINNGPRDVKDIQITCTHFAKSGTRIDSNTRTIYDIVKAGKKKRFNKFNMGFIHSQAQSSSCEITDLTLM